MTRAPMPSVWTEILWVVVIVTPIAVVVCAIL